MRKLAIVAGLLALAAVAVAQSVPPVLSKTLQQTYLSDGGVTNPFTAPSGICTAAQGVDMSMATGWQVILSADAGDTFAGGGQALCYYCATTYASGQVGSATTNQWCRCPTQFDVTPTAGVQISPSIQFTSSVGAGRIFYLPVAIGVIRPDAGYRDAGVDVTIQVQRHP